MTRWLACWSSRDSRAALLQVQRNGPVHGDTRHHPPGRVRLEGGTGVPSRGEPRVDSLGPDAGAEHSRGQGEPGGGGDAARGDRRRLLEGQPQAGRQVRRLTAEYAPYLHYDRYLAAGYPIATGVIEGACRYLVRDRMELTGARWRLVGAEAVVKLRALRASGDFDAYWDFHEAREYERNHAQRYTGGTVPPVTEPPPPPSSPRLRRVK